MPLLVTLSGSFWDKPQLNLYICFIFIVVVIGKARKSLAILSHQA